MTVIDVDELPRDVTEAIKPHLASGMFVEVMGTLSGCLGSIITLYPPEIRMEVLTSVLARIREQVRESLS